MRSKKQKQSQKLNLEAKLVEIRENDATEYRETG